MLVEELMTPDPLTLTVDSTFELAEKFMSFAHVRHLPVVDGHELVGLVTHRDLLRASISIFNDLSRPGPEGARRMIPVTELMRRDVTTISPTADLRTAARTMIDHKYGCLPVVDHGRLVGILTEADFLKCVIHLLEQEEVE